MRVIFDSALELALIVIVLWSIGLGACSPFHPDPVVSETPSDIPALSGEAIKWGLTACEKYGGIRTIFTSGKVVCKNGWRIYPPKNGSQAKK